MKEEVIILDNLLDKSKLIKLQDYFIKNQNNLIWFYQKNINYATKNNFQQILTKPSQIQTTKNDGFVIMFNRKETPIADDICELIEEIKINVSDKLKFEIKDTLRIKINLNKPQLLNDDEINQGIHIDRELEHLTFIYYLNTNDGYTLLYEKDKKTIKNKIECIENRLVVFDGLTPHVGVPSKSDDKCLINLNIIEKKINTKLI